VAIETECKLSKVRDELLALKKEYAFVNRNRDDLELALQASQVEKNIV